MTKPDWVEKHLEQITLYQNTLDSIPEDQIQARIDILSEQLVYIGKLAAELSEGYKRIYAERKRVAAEARINATDNKEARSELAVVELRKEEAEAYGDMRRWNNAFESTKERIHALKYKQRIGIEDGSNRIGG